MSSPCLCGMCLVLFISLIPTGLHSISNRAMWFPGKNIGLQVMGNEMMFPLSPAPGMLRGSMNLWSVWTLARWLMNRRFLTAVLMFTELSSAQFKKKRRGKRDFHPLLVKLPGLRLQHCFQMLRTEAKQHFFTGEHSVPEFAQQAFVLN